MIVGFRIVGVFRTFPAFAPVGLHDSACVTAPDMLDVALYCVDEGEVMIRELETETWHGVAPGVGCRRRKRRPSNRPPPLSPKDRGGGSDGFGLGDPQPRFQCLRHRMSGTGGDHIDQDLCPGELAEARDRPDEALFVFNFRRPDGARERADAVGRGSGRHGRLWWAALRQPARRPLQPHDPVGIDANVVEPLQRQEKTW